MFSLPRLRLESDNSRMWSDSSVHGAKCIFELLISLLCVLQSSSIAACFFFFSRTEEAEMALCWRRDPALLEIVDGWSYLILSSLLTKLRHAFLWKHECFWNAQLLSAARSTGQLFCLGNYFFHIFSISLEFVRCSLQNDRLSIMCC